MLPTHFVVGNKQMNKDERLEQTFLMCDSWCGKTIATFNRNISGEAKHKNDIVVSELSLSLVLVVGTVCCPSHYETHR